MAAQQKSDSKQSKTSSPKRQAAKPAPVASALEQSPMEMQQAIGDPGAASPSAILQLQRVAGNRAVQRLLASRKVQAKLTVGPAGDKYEREADRVAAEVMRSSEPTPPPERDDELEDGAIQTKPLASSMTPAVRRKEEEGDEEIQPRRTDPAAGFETGAGVESQLAANRGNGSPLPADTRSFMEPRFGADFRNVRVYTGDKAAHLNRKLSAQAFTHRNDIYFSAGRYNPGNSGGKELLAHELTHVIQQGGAKDNKIRAKFRTAGAGVIQRYTHVKKGFKVDLDSDEGEGRGHTIAKHVGKQDTSDFLAGRVIEEGVETASTYEDKSKAQEVTTAAVAANSSTINTWYANKCSGGKIAVAYSGSKTGLYLEKHGQVDKKGRLRRGAQKKRENLKQADGTTVVLKREEGGADQPEYFVLTSYPTPE